MDCMLMASFSSSLVFFGCRRRVLRSGLARLRVEELPPQFLSPFPFLPSPLVKASRIALCVDHTCIIISFLIMYCLHFHLMPSLITNIRFHMLIRENVNGL
eukprot:TRINITY_DN22690_c0_g1_i1.p1 TRINITY_DN22690_c0_g1~~TRINITY_DN22690_c0_g1_i1.p1  ORF type:complete len:101 (-),score=11.77 TRINITY_DN22690_c0_g1_i1:533-835(-)